jgi:hypothetical protein
MRAKNNTSNNNNSEFLFPSQVRKDMDLFASPYSISSNRKAGGANGLAKPGLFVFQQQQHQQQQPSNSNFPTNPNFASNNIRNMNSNNNANSSSHYQHQQPFGTISKSSGREMSNVNENGFGGIGSDFVQSTQPYSSPSHGKFFFLFYISFLYSAKCYFIFFPPRLYFYYSCLLLS